MKLVMAGLACLLTCSAAQAAISGKQAEAIFRSGLAAAHAGRHEIAIKDFRHLLREVPSPRIKLELARSLFLTRRYRESLSIFKEVYREDGTPQIVKRNILPFIEEAELRTLRVRYGARIVTDTNPSKVAESGTIYFNGYPFEYRPPVRKKVSYGIEPWISAEKLWRNGLLTKFYGSARLFGDNELDTGSLEFAVAKHVEAVPGLFVQTAVDTWISDQNSYVLPSIEAWKRFRLSDRAGFGLGAQIGYMKVENGDISGGFYRPYMFADWTFSPNATAFVKTSIEYLNSNNDYYTHYSPEIALGIYVSLGTLNLTPKITAGLTKFPQFDEFWGLNRSGITWRPEITISDNRLEWNGIRPELNIFYEERDSNVDIYDYSQIGGSVNLTRLF